MITVKLFVWSLSAAIDLGSNFVSIFEVIENIDIPNIPSVLTETKLTVMLERDIKRVPDIINCTLTIKNNKIKIGENAFEINFEGARRNRTIIRMPIVEIKEEGLYTFILTYKKKPLAKYEVDVKNSKEKPVKDGYVEEGYTLPGYTK